MSKKPGPKPKYAWHTISNWAEQSDADIARQLGCARKTVQQHRKRHKHPPSPIDTSPANVDWASVDWDLKNDDIAAQWNVSAQTVHEYRNRVGRPRSLTPPPPGQNTADTRAIRTDLTKTPLPLDKHTYYDWDAVDWALTDAEIHAQLGAATATIRRRRIQAGTPNIQAFTIRITGDQARAIKQQHRQTSVENTLQEVINAWLEKHVGEHENAPSPATADLRAIPDSAWREYTNEEIAEHYGKPGRKEASVRQFRRIHNKPARAGFKREPVTPELEAMRKKLHGLADEDWQLHTNDEIRQFFEIDLHSGTIGTFRRRHNKPRRTT